jgi:putative transposase
MTSPAASYHAYRFPPEIISHAVWLYHRFCLSFRDTEGLLAQRGITLSYEAIRQWCRNSVLSTPVSCGAGKDAWAIPGI